MKPLMREGLRHKYCGTSDDEFFAAIDSSGGWPVGYKFVGFEHTSERYAGFTNSPSNGGWWTIVASADDYYLWKLSPAALQRVVEAVLNGSRILGPNIQYLNIKNSRGYKVTIAKVKGDEHD